MNEHIDTDAKMQTNKESQTRWHKASIASKACFHTKQKGKHVIKHIERLTWVTLTCKAKQRRKKARDKLAKHHKDVSSHMVASKQANKGDGCNQTKQLAPKTNKRQPTKGKHTRKWQKG